MRAKCEVQRLGVGKHHHHQNKMDEFDLIIECKHLLTIVGAKKKCSKKVVGSLSSGQILSIFCGLC